MNPLKLGILGSGGLGTALLRAWRLASVKRDLPLTTLGSHYRPEKAQMARVESGAAVLCSNVDLIQRVETVVICVQPSKLPSVLREISEKLTDRHLIVSTVAGYSKRQIKESLPHCKNVVTVMPSSLVFFPSLIDHATHLVSEDNGQDEDAVKTVSKLFSLIGRVVMVPECELSKWAVLTASSPAFSAQLLNEFALAFERADMDSVKVRKILYHNAIAVAKAMSEGADCPDIVQKIATPGGVTEAGLRRLAEKAPPLFANIVDTAIGRYTRLSEPKLK